MSLVERREISEVTVLPLENAIQVKWRETIERDGVPIHQNDHYRIFGSHEVAIFMDEVPNGKLYSDILGWVFDVVEPSEPTA